MKRLNILWIGLISVLMTACYDDYEKDYDKSSVYFASQKPLRTLVARYVDKGRSGHWRQKRSAYR